MTERGTPEKRRATSALRRLPRGALALASALDPTAFDAAVSTWLSAMGDDMPYFQNTLPVLYLHAAAGKFPSTL